MAWRSQRTRWAVVVTAGLLAAVVLFSITASGRDAGSDPTLVGVRTDPLAGGVAEARPPASLALEPDTPRTSTPAAPAQMELPDGAAPPLSQVSTTDPVIFLTIDDGNTRDPAVLDYLQAEGLPFSSFLLAGEVTEDPAFWARHRAIGGTIHAHSLTHANLTKVSADQIRDELCGSADAIAAVTGVRPTLFRPPYGAYNTTVEVIAAECDFAALPMWKGTVNDGVVTLQEPALAPGDIILMHWRPALLADLQAIKAMADAQGFRIARLEDYLFPAP